MKMKKYYLLSITLLLLFGNTSFAKKVKFAVDMSNDTINSLGLYVSGDFQAAAGFASDWCAACTPLTQEGSTGIYSVVVDIPAFRKYEYKFLNGDQFYNAEFVPVESRVGYDFNDNRWIYVDSLANDTTSIGAVFFAGNAPAGLNLVRFIVDMQGETVSGSLPHVAGDFQGWDPMKTILYSFGSNVYEIINYVPAGNVEYKFYNGNTSGTSEIISGSCAVAGNRVLTVPHDTVLEMICFSSCLSCTTTGITKLNNENKTELYPNPAEGTSVLKFNDGSATHTVIVRDVSGRMVRSYTDYSGTELFLENDNLSSGIYSVSILNSEKITSLKYIIQ
jgi:alpha-amylase